MARKLSDIQALRDNTHAGKTGSSYGSKRPISVSDLRTWMNSNFFRGNSTSITDNTPTTGNAGISDKNISVNSSFNNMSWISIRVKGTSETDHNYYKGTKGRLRIYCESAIAGHWKMKINSTEYTASGNSWMDTGNTLDVRPGTSTYTPNTTTGTKNYSVELHYSFNGGTTYSKITGITATIGFGASNCSWSNGTDTALSLGGSGGTEGAGGWDHLTYN